MASYSLAGLRILILEDEPLIALEVEELCRENDASLIDICGSLTDCEAVMQRTYDLALVDLILRGESAIGFACRLNRAGARLVFTTGSQEGMDLARNFPGVPVVMKPYTAAGLLEAIGSALSGSGSR
ncbi:MAG: response regulator [Rhizobiaceae bacterium]|nr:response regulator [Rhizobiaceae bacterium]